MTFYILALYVRIQLAFIITFRWMKRKKVFLCSVLFLSCSVVIDNEQ